MKTLTHPHQSPPPPSGELTRPSIPAPAPSEHLRPRGRAGGVSAPSEAGGACAARAAGRERRALPPGVEWRRGPTPAPPRPAPPAPVPVDAPVPPPIGSATPQAPTATNPTNATKRTDLPAASLARMVPALTGRRRSTRCHHPRCPLRRGTCWPKIRRRRGTLAADRIRRAASGKGTCNRARLHTSRRKVGTGKRARIPAGQGTPRGSTRRGRCKSTSGRTAPTGLPAILPRLRRRLSPLRPLPRRRTERRLCRHPRPRRLLQRMNPPPKLHRFPRRHRENFHRLRRPRAPIDRQRPPHLVLLWSPQPPGPSAPRFRRSAS
jgi:hypothetical protein